MKGLLLYVDQHIGKRIILAISLAIVFPLISRSIFDVYYQYIDTRQYVTFSQPISVNRKLFKPCDQIVLTAKVKAMIDTNLSSLTQLVLVQIDGSTQRVGGSIQRNIPIRKAEEHVVSRVLNLPCELDDGLYYYQGNVAYDVFGNEKTFSFITDTFSVNKTGVNANTTDLINESTSSAKEVR